MDQVLAERKLPRRCSESAPSRPRSSGSQLYFDRDAECAPRLPTLESAFVMTPVTDAPKAGWYKRPGDVYRS